jgi:hypothetical protein
MPHLFGVSVDQHGKGLWLSAREDCTDRLRGKDPKGRCCGHGLWLEVLAMYGHAPALQVSDVQV